jgi:hypothetical protein
VKVLLPPPPSCRSRCHVRLSARLGHELPITHLNGLPLAGLSLLRRSMRRRRSALTAARPLRPTQALCTAYHPPSPAPPPPLCATRAAPVHAPSVGLTRRRARQHLSEQMRRSAHLPSHRACLAPPHVFRVASRRPRCIVVHSPPALHPHPAPPSAPPAGLPSTCCNLPPCGPPTL